MDTANNWNSDCFALLTTGQYETAEKLMLDHGTDPQYAKELVENMRSSNSKMQELHKLQLKLDKIKAEVERLRKDGMSVFSVPEVVAREFNVSHAFVWEFMTDGVSLEEFEYELARQEHLTEVELEAEKKPRSNPGFMECRHRYKEGERLKKEVRRGEKLLKELEALR